MPLKLLAQLDAKLAALGDFHRELADAPVLLDRAETSVRVFRGIRAKLAEAAPNIHELKGLSAGIRQAAPIVQQHAEIVKQRVKDEKMDPALGKELVGVIAAAINSLREGAEARTVELHRAAGKVDGLYAAADSALEDVVATLASFRRSKEAEGEEEDWSGRGTPNGQRAPGAQEAAGEAGNGNGKGKVVPLKKAPQGRIPRVKKPKAEPTPDA